MTKPKDIFDIVEEEFVDLESKFKDKKVTVNQFNKGTTELAYKLAMAGFPDEAASLLSELQGDYFAGQAVQEMNADAEFFRKCAIMFEIFSYSGLTPYDAMCTQPEAKA